MREIKFRAWDNNKMYYQVRCGGVFDGIPTAPTVWNEGKGDWLNLTGQPYTKVMQYTGLKDKNNKDVYESDIVRWTNRAFTDCSKKEMIGEQLFVGSIYWKDTMWAVDTHDGFGRMLMPYFSETDEIEVIGNIHEDSELLK